MGELASGRRRSLKGCGGHGLSLLLREAAGLVAARAAAPPVG